MSTATTTPNLNHAAAELIEALEAVDNLPGLREGIRRSVAFWGSFADPNQPSHHDARQLITAWQALDDLAAAVAARKE